MIICTVISCLYSNQKQRVKDSRKVGDVVLYAKEGMPGIGVITGIYKIAYDRKDLTTPSTGRTDKRSDTIYEICPNHTEVDWRQLMTDQAELICCNGDMEIIKDNDRLADAIAYVKRAQKNEEFFQKCNG